MRRVLLCRLEAVEGEFCLPEALEMMCRMLICMLEAVEGELSFGVSKFPLWQNYRCSLPPWPFERFCIGP